MKTITPTTLKEELAQKIVQKKANVAIVGLGYVGLPTAFEKATQGYSVTGFDVSEEKVELINKGVNYISDIDDALFEELVLNKKGLHATTNFKELSEMDVIFICVPTPIDDYKQPDLKYVQNAVKVIAQNIKKGALVILESTTYPGTTEEVVLPPFEKQRFSVGEDVFIAYSPERIDPGNQQFGLANTPKIVGGITSSCTELAALVLGEMAYPVSSAKIAEMSKVFENTFRFINIGLINETAKICEKLDIDVWEMVEASGTKPYGFMPFQPGPGIGGHCIPVDPYYLTWKAKSMGQTTNMIELAGNINDSMSEYIVHRIMSILNKEEKPLKGSKVAVLGLAYKKDINDLRESPVLPIVEQLLEAGADLLLCDPHVDSLRIGEQVMPIKQDEKEVVECADIVVLTTNHSAFDYEYIASKSSVIFDTRNAFKEQDGMNATYYKL